LLARVAAALQVETPPLVLSSAIENAASDGYKILVNPTWARATLAQFCADRCMQQRGDARGACARGRAPRRA
jgi:hypothetical protein